MSGLLLVYFVYVCIYVYVYIYVCVHLPIGKVEKYVFITYDQQF